MIFFSMIMIVVWSAIYYGTPLASYLIGKIKKIALEKGFPPVFQCLRSQYFFHVFARTTVGPKKLVLAPFFKVMTMKLTTWC